MTATEFAEKYLLTLKCKPIPKRTDGIQSQWGLGASHYKIRLKSPILGKLKFEYSMGSAHTEPPTLANVVECLNVDASFYYKTPWEFFEEFGFKPTKENLGIYEACKTMHAKMADFMPEFVQEELASIEF